MKIQRMCIFPHSVEMFFFYTWWKCFFSTLGGNGSNFCQEVSVRPQKVQELHSPDHRNLAFHLWDSNLILTTLSDFFLSKEDISKHTQTTFQPKAESNMKQKMVLQLSVCIMWIYLEQRCSLFDLVLGFLALRTRVGSSRKQV